MVVKYRKTKSLGKGGFGETFVVTNDSTKHFYVLKILFAKKFNKKLFDQEVENLKNSKEECGKYVPKFYQSGNIVRSSSNGQEYFSFDENGKEQGILMEWVEWPTSDKIFELKDEDLVTISKSLFEAIACIHKNNIFHRDIKPNNISIKNKRDVILLDFGLSCKMEECLKVMSGTPMYYSPEIINYLYGKSKLTDEIIKKSDVWAAGLTLFYIAYHINPYYKESEFTRDVIGVKNIPNPDFIDDDKLKSISKDQKEIYKILFSTVKNSPNIYVKYINKKFPLFNKILKEVLTGDYKNRKSAAEMVNFIDRLNSSNGFNGSNGLIKKI